MFQTIRIVTAQITNPLIQFICFSGEFFLCLEKVQRITVAKARPERMMLRVSSYVKPAAMIAGTTREMDSRPRRRSEKPTMS